MSKKIDEQTLKDAVTRGIPRDSGYMPPPYNPPKYNDDDVTDGSEIKESPRILKGRNSELERYKAKYLQKTEKVGRQFICVSDELHKSLSKLVNGLEVKGASISSYAENILRDHLDEHREMLNNDYKRKYEAPIGW